MPLTIEIGRQTRRAAHGVGHAFGSFRAANHESTDNMPDRAVRMPIHSRPKAADTHGSSQSIQFVGEQEQISIAKQNHLDERAGQMRRPSGVQRHRQWCRTEGHRRKDDDGRCLGGQQSREPGTAAIP